ncbi:UNVERIFIED_CONTAM: Transposon Ty1-BL Gag-Pol polyprotein [Sesamum radiatum]|uniref:Transposon Ty1-BL Gag-Pol polyprotein n=1 Tax=Sesamum radiatum TaxID=300843 RepID=A0AAW2K643_SESRA
MGKGKKRMGTQQQLRANDICAHCHEKGHWKRDFPNLSFDQGIFFVEVNMVTNSASWVLDTGCGTHICNDLQVLQRSRKLSKDEVVLRLGDGKVVAAEAVGIINLVVSDRVRLELKDCYFVPNVIKNIISIPLFDNVGFEFLINKNYFYLMTYGSSHLLGKLNNGLYILQRSDWIMTAQYKRKLENFENAQIWHARLGHISQDRMKRLVHSKSLEIDNLDNLPACESCLKGKMTRKPFVGHSKLANGLLDLIHTDVCGPLNTQARGGFSYFITFTDDHSRYGYVYLMSYKSEAFVKFKEHRLEVENQIGCKIKTLRSDRGREYLSGEFIDFLKENSIVSKWTLSRSWNIHFDEVIRGYDFVKNDFDPCVYKKVSGSSVVFLVLYVDDILLIENYVKMLGDTKASLSTQFSMKDLGEASYILGIKIFRDRSKRILGMT